MKLHYRRYACKHNSANARKYKHVTLSCKFCHRYGVTPQGTGICPDDLQEKIYGTNVITLYSNV